MQFSRTTFFAFVLFITYSSWAQTGGVKGYLFDEADSSRVGYATVAVFNTVDSSVVNFALTDGRGGFEIGRLPINTPLRLFVSHVLYTNYRKDFSLDSAQVIDLDSLWMNKKTNELEEAVVSWEKPPILVKGDTVQFNADAFLNRPGSVVEDLLKNIPGVNISEDGQITFNGRAVSSITIDSKTFFGDDPTILLKNIPAKAIKDVQVTEEKDERGKETNSGNVTINLTLKDWAKTGHFGKIYAGYGSDNRYESGALWNFFRDTLQISVIGYGNNLSNQAFSYADVYQLGGFNRSGVSTIMSTGDGRTYYDGIGFGGGNGITESGGGGFNLNYALPKTLRANLAYFIGFTRRNYNEDQFRQDFLNGPDSSITYTTNNLEFERQSRHTIKGDITWTPDTINLISYEPLFKIGFQENFNRNQQNNRVLEQGHSSAVNNRRLLQSDYWSYSGELLWDQDYDKFSWRISNDHSINRSSGLGFNAIRLIDSDSMNPNSNEFQVINDDRNGLSSNTQLRLHFEPNDSLHFYIFPRWNYSNSIQNTLINLEDSNGVFVDRLLPDVSTQFREERQEFSAYLGLLKSRIWKKFSLTLGLEPSYTVLNLSNDIRNASSERVFPWLEPSIRFVFRDAAWGYNSIRYQYQLNLPRSWDLLDVTDNRNPNFLRKGNPNLNAIPEHEINLYSYIPGRNKFKVGAYLNASYSFMQGGFARDISYDNLGRQVSTPFNLGDSLNSSRFHVYSNINKSVNTKKLDHRFGLYISYSYQNTYTSINGLVQKQVTNYYSFGPSYGLIKKDKLDIKIRYSPGISNTNLESSDRVIQRLNHDASAEVWWALNEKNWFEAKYNLTALQILSSESIPQQFNLLNLSYTRRILKDNAGQIRLSVFDVLGQNTDIQRQVGANYYFESQANTITRYVMLSFVYNLHQFKTTGRSKRGFEFW